MKDVKVITIDGPAGAGKSSIAKAISRDMGFIHVDSGALYRAIGVICKEKGVDLKSEEEVVKVASSLNVEFKGERIFIDGIDFSTKVRTPEAGALASTVARFKGVRDVVVRLIREFASGKKIVIDGRDAGSFIFPDAGVKIYLTASPEERAKRRYKELTEKGFRISYEEILKDVLERDRSDREREFAPLVIPEGAVVIDTTGKSFEEVLSEVKKVIDC